MTPQITHDEASGRFETVVDGERGVLDYVREGGAMIITHVVVPPAIGGRGVAAALTQAAFDWARAERLKVFPQCPYADAYARRHPDLADLLA